MNWSAERRIRFVDMSHVIKMFFIISPNQFNNIFSYINKVIIKHICNVHRILMNNIILNYLLYNVSYLRFFVLMMLLMMCQVCFLSFFAALNLCS